MKELSQLRLKDKKYIIFDMDGTLIDSIGVWNITDQKLIEEYGGMDINLDDIQLERDAFLHNNQDSDIYLAYCEYLIKKYGFTIEDAQQLLKIRWDKSGEILEKEMDFKPNVVELILKLKSLGFTVALATMTTQVQLDIYSKKNRKMLQQMNIEEAFDLITRKEDVQNKKPNPEIYNKIMQHYNAKPEECLIFEDSYTGVLASNNAGIEVINVYDKYADLDRDKINEITDYSINNYKEFIELVNYLYPSVSKDEPDDLEI
jgi:HAD superfamily hydrolase (TIGR01509 family)